MKTSNQIGRGGIMLAEAMLEGLRLSLRKKHKWSYIINSNVLEKLLSIDIGL
jgi:hypothetical protein